MTKGAIFTGNIKAATIIKHTSKAKRHSAVLPEDYFITMGATDKNRISDHDLTTIKNIDRMLKDLRNLLTDEE